LFDRLRGRTASALTALFNGKLALYRPDDNNNLRYWYPYFEIGSSINIMHKAELVLYN